MVSLIKIMDQFVNDTCLRINKIIIKKKRNKRENQRFVLKLWLNELKSSVSIFNGSY